MISVCQERRPEMPLSELQGKIGLPPTVATWCLGICGITPEAGT